MHIQLLNNKAISIKLSKSIKKIAGRIFDLNFFIDYDKQDLSIFKVTFKLSLVNPQKYHLYVEYVSIFKCSESITDEFRNSHFPHVNAPAISYPFLRTFVSFLSLNCGYDSILLPTINFTEFKNKPANSQLKK